MPDHDSRVSSLPGLPRHGKDLLQVTPPDNFGMPPGETQKLQLHPINLKRQNEEPRLPRTELVQASDRDSSLDEHKHDEESLRLFRTLVDRADDTFEIIDPATARFIDVNEKGCLELGLTREEYLSLRVMDIDPTITEAAWPGMVARLQSEGPLNGEGIHRRKDGTTIPIEYSACWVSLDRNYIVTVVRDITKRQRAAQSLEVGRLRVTGLVESAMDAIISFDDGQRINLFNRAAEKMFLCPARDAIGRTIDRFIPGRFHTSQTGRMHLLGGAGYHRSREGSP